MAEIDAIFAARTYDEWKETLSTLTGVWAPVQQANELVNDPQVIANGYVPRVVREDGVEFDLVANPVQFDEEPEQLVAAPEHGQHTEEILLELGFDWDAIIARKEAGDIL